MCLPEALLPENLAMHCAALTSPAACDVFDAPGQFSCHWEPTQVHCDGQCTPGGVSGACIAFSYAGEGCGACGSGSSGRAYQRPRAGGTEIFFNTRCGDEPIGWSECSLEPDDPLCQCFCDDF